MFWLHYHSFSLFHRPNWRLIHDVPLPHNGEKFYDDWRDIPLDDPKRVCIISSVDYPYFHFKINQTPDGWYEVIAKIVRNKKVRYSTLHSDWGWIDGICDGDVGYIFSLD